MFDKLIGFFLVLPRIYEKYHFHHQLAKHKHVLLYGNVLPHGNCIILGDLPQAEAENRQSRTP
jgi:hypothetical protein